MSGSQNLDLVEKMVPLNERPRMVQKIRIRRNYVIAPSLPSLNLRLEEAGKIRNSLFLEQKIQVDIAPVDVLAGMPNNLFAHVCRHLRVSQRGNETVAKAVKTERFELAAFALIFGSKWSSNTCQVHQSAKMRCLNPHGCRDFFGRGSGRLVHSGRQRQGVTRNMSQDPGSYRHRIFLSAFCATSSLSRPEYENPFEQINVHPNKVCGV